MLLISFALFPPTHQPTNPPTPGGVLGIVNYHANLLEVSNSIALWLGISPPDLFFYAFLPPLLVDSAIRIDFFMFRKVGLFSV